MSEVLPLERIRAAASAAGRFGPLREDHPSVGERCPLCGRPLLAGDRPCLVALGPADEEERAKAAAGRAHNAEALVAHESCVWGDDA